MHSLGRSSVGFSGLHHLIKRQLAACGDGQVWSKQTNRGDPITFPDDRVQVDASALPPGDFDARKRAEPALAGNQEFRPVFP
jgi:hypothetical protein